MELPITVYAISTPPASRRTRPNRFRLDAMSHGRRRASPVAARGLIGVSVESALQFALSLICFWRAPLCRRRVGDEQRPFVASTAPTERRPPETPGLAE